MKLWEIIQKIRKIQCDHLTNVTVLCAYDNSAANTGIAGCGLRID